jgi:3-oxo-5alpha-steroid 4-dehydrogenase
LAQKLTVEPARTSQTIREYNDAIRNEVADPVGKRSYRSVIAEAPYYGIDISLQPGGLMVTPALPLGGLKVEGASGKVIGEVGEAIGGLYAVGKTDVGLSSHQYISGLALADCVFSGITAEGIARRTS